MNHGGTNSRNQVMHQNFWESLTKTLASYDIGYIGWWKELTIITYQLTKASTNQKILSLHIHNLTLFLLYFTKRSKRKKFKKWPHFYASSFMPPYIWQHSFLVGFVNNRLCLWGCVVKLCKVHWCVSSKKINFFLLLWYLVKWPERQSERQSCEKSMLKFLICINLPWF